MRTYEITNTFPTPIVADFDEFLTGIESPGVYLTKAKLTLDRATLYALNARMRTFRTETHPPTDQEYYPLLNLFQRICMAARLHLAQPVKGKLRMVPTEAVAAFRQLSPCEKYVALLEALWIDVDWGEIARTFGEMLFLDEEDLINSLTGLPVGEEVGYRAAARACIRLGMGDGRELLTLSFFGLLSCQCASRDAGERDLYRKGWVKIMNPGLPSVRILLVFIEKVDNKIKIY